MELSKILDLLNKDFSFSRKNGIFNLQIAEFEFSAENLDELITNFYDFITTGKTPKKSHSENSKNSNLNEEIQKIMEEFLRNPPVKTVPNPKTGFPFEIPTPIEIGDWPPLPPQIFCMLRNFFAGEK